MTEITTKPRTVLTEDEHTKVAHCLEVLTRYAGWAAKDSDAWGTDLFLTSIIESAEGAREIVRGRLEDEGWKNVDGHWTAPDAG